MSSIDISMEIEKEHILKVSDVLVALFFAINITLLLNFNMIIKFILREEQATYDQLYLETLEKGQGLFQFIQSNSVTTITTVLMWSVVYMIGYSVIYFIYQETKTARDETRVHKSYLHPRNIKESTFWESSLWYMGYPVLVLALSIIWLVISISYLMPFTQTTMLIALYGDNTYFSATALVLLAVSVMTLMLIGFIVIFRLIKTISRFIW